MIIGIDARLYGPRDTGIGRYVENLVRKLLEIDKKNYYVLFVRKENPLLSFEHQIPNIKLVVADVRHYSLKEQFLMPYLIKREKIDLMHFPHFNVPLFYSGRYVITIHDLIKHSSKGLETTTLNPFFYWLKYAGYKLVFKNAVKRAKLIFVPSKTISFHLKKLYKIPDDKIVVTYEGVDERIKTGYRTIYGDSKKILEKYKIKKPYFLYVGNVYPHKNIPNLIEAVKISNQKLPINLVIVCPRNIFLERLKIQIGKLGEKSFVNLIGFVPDEQLGVLFRQSEGFIFPSLSEGFGLPGIEAMALGCCVLCSNIPVFKEIYKNAVLYFDPKDPQKISKTIIKFLKKKQVFKKVLRKKGRNVLKNYSWKKVAKAIFEGYKKALRS